MTPLQELYNQIQEDESEMVYLPKRRKEIPELITKYDYCLHFSKMINKPVGYVLGKSKGWPLDWFISIYSELKSIREPLSRVKYVNWFLREGRIK